MKQTSSSSAGSFTAPERDLIRREFGQHFGSYPAVAEGIFLRTWRGGPEVGQPKVPPAIRTMIARGLVEVRLDRRMPGAFFTEMGMAALREFAMNHRYLDPIRYAHVRRELGLRVEEDATVSHPPAPSTEADYGRSD